MGAPDLLLTLEELSRQLDMMDQLVHRETPAQRLVWNRKILELRHDLQSIQQQANRYDQQVNFNLRHQREREALLTRRGRRTTGTGTSAAGEEQQDMANLADESRSLHQASLMVDDLLSTGQASLQGLVDQRSRLKGVRKVVGEIGNRLGLTNMTMKIIERRDITDAYLVLAGMIVTCFVIYLCYFHFEP